MHYLANFAQTAFSDVRYLQANVQNTKNTTLRDAPTPVNGHTCGASY
jgi:hypothetical protein